jgi:hypothetical protein
MELLLLVIGTGLFDRVDRQILPENNITSPNAFNHSLDLKRRLKVSDPHQFEPGMRSAPLSGKETS